MAPRRIDFREAFDRWSRVCATERLAVEAREKRGETLVSREALDHLCGLSVEVGLKYLMIQRRFVPADATGDYPAGTDGRRPHIDELWDVFMARVSARDGAELFRALGGAGQLKVFQTWRSSNRYAPDATVREVEAKPRLDFLKKLNGVIAQEGA